MCINRFLSVVTVKKIKKPLPEHGQAVSFLGGWLALGDEAGAKGGDTKGTDTLPVPPRGRPSGH